MAKDDKRTLKPKLRFPKFRDCEGWQSVPMGDLISLEYGKSLPEHSRRSGSIPVTGSNGIVGYHDEPLIKGPAIVIGRKGSVGQVTWIKSDCFPIDTTFYVENKRPSKNLMRFLYRLLQVSELENRRDPGAVPGLNRNEVHSLRTAIPGRCEQKKIAECLTSLDDLIVAQGRKVEALKAHKKGLMQQLFPREGETLPRLRFPEFRDNNRSSFRPINEFAKVTTGGKDTQNKVEDGKYPFFVRSQNVERINSYSHDGEGVLTSGDGVGVGENYHYVKGKYDFHQRVYCIYDFSGEAFGKFFFYYFSLHFKKRIKQMSAKNSVDSVRMPMVTEMPIWLPQIKEQQRIANCLSALDDRIVAEADKLAALKMHKKGLLQQLFPSPEESL